MAEYDSLGQRIRTTRVELGLRQRDVAEAAGVSTAAVSQWEQGDTKDVKLPHFFAIADLFKVNPRWLALGQGPRFMKAAVVLLALLIPPYPAEAMQHKVLSYAQVIENNTHWIRTVRTFVLVMLRRILKPAQPYARYLALC